MNQVKRIETFQGPYRFLSNFYPAAVFYEGIAYRTSEHAYQAAKTLDLALRQEIADADTPGKAKRAGQKIELRKDWDQVRLQVMEEILRSKFAEGSRLLTWLRNTGSIELIEGNTWGDRFWGVCGGVGENHLGKLLMKIRDNP